MRGAILFLVALVGLTLIGCGSRGLKPKGQLLKKGEPFVAGEGETVQMMFFTEDDKADEQAYNVNVDPKDGSFQVVGVANRGIPPGKYRATVTVLKNRKDVFNGAYGRTRTPFHFDVASSSDELKIDLDTPGGTAAPARTVSRRRDQAR